VRLPVSKNEAAAVDRPINKKEAECAIAGKAGWPRKENESSGNSRCPSSRPAEVAAVAIFGDMAGRVC
jgi:hypothetical protein